MANHTRPVGPALSVSLALASLMALMITSAAHAQTRAASVSFEGITDARARATLQAAVRNADESGVPVEPLYSKIREGVAKQSDPERIADAVRQLAVRLTIAKEALANSRTSDEIAAGAGALQVGVPTSALRQLRRAWPVQSLTVPLGVVTELVAYGVPAAQATVRVRELMQGGASNAQLVELSTQVQRDVATGGAASTALDRRARGTMSILAVQPKSALTPVGPPTYRPR